MIFSFKNIILNWKMENINMYELKSLENKDKKELTRKGMFIILDKYKFSKNKIVFLFC